MRREFEEEKEEGKGTRLYCLGLDIIMASVESG